jgi:hypothetical protein
MPAKRNLLGQKFGRLTVIKEDPIRRNGKVCWFCQCDCENKTIKSIVGSDLINKKIISCGCYQKEKVKILGSKTKIDMANKKIGKLTVIEDSGRRSNTEIIWKCICECGTITFVRGSDLRRKKILSCGCISSKGEEKISKILSDNNILFEKQKTYENLTSSKNAKLRFDFYLPEYNCCIEYDGIQHFKETFYTHDDFNKRKERDNLKNKYCKENNIKLIRIPYTDYSKIDYNYLKEKGAFDE